MLRPHPSERADWPRPPQSRPGKKNQLLDCPHWLYALSRLDYLNCRGTAKLYNLQTHSHCMSPSHPNITWHTQIHTSTMSHIILLVNIHFTIFDPVSIYNHTPTHLTLHHTHTTCSSLHTCFHTLSTLLTLASFPGLFLIWYADVYA